jgi:uncharacterized damage-inducible protein DinB
MFIHTKDTIIPVQTLVVILFGFLISPAVSYSQSMTESFQDRFLLHFEQSADKLMQLAEAMPEEIYGWSPDGEAMTTARVFMHIARYNYILPSGSLNIEIPGDVDPSVMEEIQDKETVIIELEKSIRHIRNHIARLTEEELRQPAEIYGETTESWSALFLLMTHKSEHVGQLISYARMNGVVPPWSL